MNQDPRGYYAALHVAPDATAAELQHAFRALMRLSHPDVEAAAGAQRDAGNNAGDDARSILEAFAVLRDPQSRAEYDAAAAPAGPGPASSGGREVPVRHHRHDRPVLTVTPVRWERGPL